ncbi:MAG: Gfo/Idh/MocA family oxidoreductase [Pseudomonadota bacterium]
MTGRLKVAIVGTGFFSQFHFDAWARCPEVEIVGVAGLEKQAVEQRAAEFSCPAFSSVDDMLANVKADLLDVITPPPSHADMITTAAEHGVNVICQKPFCSSLDEARQVISSAQAAGIDVTIHENFRFQPWYGAMAWELKEQRLGRLYQATFRFRPGDGQGPEAYLERQPYFQEMERFLIHETVIHFVDVFRYLFGEVQSVWADLTKLNPAIKGEDRCLVVLDHGNGFRGVIDGNRLSDHQAKNRRLTMGEMTIEGEKGVLHLNGDGSVVQRAHGENVWEPVNYSFKDHGFGGDCVYLFTRHVVDHYVSGLPRSNSAQDYLANLEIEDAIYRSASKTCRISIAQ